MAVLAACKQVVEWITKILDPQCPSDERAACHQRVEELKEQSPHCVACGFQLATEQDSMIKHFGLQLLEHFVKYRWQSLQEAERKDFSLQLLQHLSLNLLPLELEAPYVKEALARVVVELAKKMWPQHWPSFLGDLHILTQCGPSQVEIVLLVFRRLAEELHIYSTDLTTSRKREMNSALGEQITAVFQFLLQNLESPPVEGLRQVALSAVTSYVEWMEFSDLLAQDCKLLRLLYNFIGQEELKTPACECLLTIVSRKGDVKRTAAEREKLLVLMSKDALQVIWDASVQAASQGADEAQYVFLKRVCQVLVELGTSQLALLWDGKLQPPEGFELYLKVMLEFFKHQSQLLCMTVSSQWSLFLSHNYIKENPTFKNFLPELYKEAARKLLRVGNPFASSTDEAAEYNKMDFDDQNEYITFYSTFRNRISLLLSKMCHKTVIPRTAFQHTLDIAHTLTQQSPVEECTKESMLYLEWDGFVGVLECWGNVLKSDPDLKNVLSEKTPTLIQAVLTYDPKDPLLLFCQLRCMLNGLIRFLDLDKQALKPYLQKIFASIQYLGELRSQERKVLAAQNIAMQCFVRLCSTLGDTLLPYLAELHEQYQTLKKNELLTYSVKSSFIEGFVVLNQLCPNLEQQTLFLRELTQEANAIFQQMQQCGALSSLSSLIQYLGLHTTPTDPGYDPKHRSQLCYVAHVINQVLKKSSSAPQQWPLSHLVPDSPELYPCYQLIMPLLFQFTLPLTSMLHELWSGSSKALTSAYFHGVYELSVVEKEVIRGKVSSFDASQPSQQDELSLMHSNLESTLDVCVQSISYAFTLFGCKHLLEVGFADAALQAIFTHAAELNSWKLRGIVRVLALNLVQICPEDLWQQVLLPFLMHTCHVVFSRLRQSWGSIEERRQPDDITFEDGVGAEMDGSEISKEVIEEQFAIILSRDYAHMLETACVTRKEEQEASDTAFDDEEMTEVPEGTAQLCSTRSKWTPHQNITTLAVELLQNKVMCELLFFSVFAGLTWNDTKTTRALTNIAGLLIIKIPEHSLVPNVLAPDIIEQLFLRVMIALQKHGMYEEVRTALTSLAQLMYELMAMQYPQLQEIMMQVQGNTPQKVQAFNALLLEKETPAVRRKRKTKFKELVSGVCGNFIAESFKRPVVFDLPEMEFKKKAKETFPESDSLKLLFERESSFDAMS